MTQQSESRAGRKRSETSRLAILRTALKLLGEGGYGALTMDAIAREAGVGKQTLYRWWRSKGEIVLEALAEDAHLHVDEVDTGSLAGDLELFISRTARRLRGDPDMGKALRGLMAEAQLDEDFAPSFRQRFIETRRAALRTLFERARARGELAAGASPELLVDMAYGSLWYRLLVGHAPLDNAYAAELTAHLLRAAGQRR